MNQADVSKLVSQLRISVAKSHRRLKNVDGPKGRLRKLQKTVTALIKHERIELNYNRADEARGYAERLISEAVRHGDCHRTTMELADFWLLEKSLVHKLFKVLVPRFQNCSVSYTKFFLAPSSYPDKLKKRSVLELRGNPYPPLKPDMSHNRNLIHNVLLDEARKEFRLQKYSELADNLAPVEGTMAATEGTVAATEGTVAATEGTVAATEGTVAATEGTVAATEGTVAATVGTYATTEGTVPPAEGEAAAEGTTATAPEQSTEAKKPSSQPASP